MRKRDTYVPLEVRENQGKKSNFVLSFRRRNDHFLKNNAMYDKTKSGMT